MMNWKNFFATGVIFCSGIVAAETVTLQTNLLNNADFSAKSGKGYALDWNHDFSTQPGIRFQGDKVFFTLGKQSVCLKQTGLTLVPGKKYRFGGQIRTKNFKAKRSSILIYNTHWSKDVNTPPFPADTKGEWKTWESTAVLPASKGNAYSFALYVGSKASGTLEMRAPFLYPAEEGAAKNVKRALSVSKAYLFTPYYPRLFKIPEENPQMTFSFQYPLPLKEQEYVCELSFKMKGEKTFRNGGTFALKKGFICVSLAKAVPGQEGVLVLSLKEKKSGKLISKGEYPFLVREKIKLTHPVEKRLNNLVLRLRSAKAADKTYAFSNPKEGFVHIRLEKYKEGTKIFFNRDRQEALPCRTGDGFEVIRYLSAGDHAVTVKGSAGGSLRINAIPEILAYSYPKIPIAGSSYKQLYGKFTKLYIDPVINIWSYGYQDSIVKKEYMDSVKRGKQWFWQLNQTRNMIAPEQIVKRFLGGNSLTHGRTFDELHFNDLTLNWNFTQAVYQVLSCDLRWYPWMSTNSEQIPGFHPLNAHLYAGIFNQGKGRGKLLFEGYAATQPTEKEAEIYLQKHLNTNLQQVERMVKGTAPHWIVILGCYTTPGSYTTHGYAGPDVKKYWDRYFYKLANDPDFKDLAGSGLYSFNNAEEEDLRWACALLRHYMIEGNKNSLAEKYGYTYLPGHLRNGDFELGNQYWIPKGAVTFTTIPNSGKKGQSRQVGNRSAGDRVALFKRSGSSPNTLTQIMKGFTKGKLYALRFAVADKKDIFSKNPSGKIHAFRAVLKGGTLIRKGLPLHEYSKELRISKNRKMNLHTWVYRADFPEITVTFDDWGPSGKNPGNNGQELLLNFIKVTPYFTE